MLTITNEKIDGSIYVKLLEFLLSKCDKVSFAIPNYKTVFKFGKSAGISDFWSAKSNQRSVSDFEARLIGHSGCESSGSMYAVYRPNRCGKDGTVPRCGTGVVRQSRGYDPSGYDGVYGKAFRGAADRCTSRICWLRRGRETDRGSAEKTLLPCLI